VVCITSGANMNFSTLRTVSELADLGGETEALLAAFIPDQPGSFFRWCALDPCSPIRPSQRGGGAVCGTMDSVCKADIWLAPKA
jgi:hypothetical protein